MYYIWYIALLKVIIFYALKDYRTYSSKHDPINVQIDRNGFFKHSKYTIL